MALTHSSKFFLSLSSLLVSLTALSLFNISNITYSLPWSESYDVIVGNILLTDICLSAIILLYEYLIIRREASRHPLADSSRVMQRVRVSGRLIGIIAATLLISSVGIPIFLLLLFILLGGSTRYLF